MKQIKFNNITTEIRKNAEGLFSLTDIEKAWRNAGGTGGQLEHWKRNADVSDMILSCEIRVSNVKTRGANAGTWGCKEAVIEYASYCSPEFRRTVRKAFIALTEGKPYEAAAIAESVAVSDELIALHDTKRLAMNVAITASSINMRGHEFSKFYDLAVKASTGYTAAQLTGRNGTAKDFIKEADSPDCLNAVIASMDLIISGLSVGLGYHEVATMLKVKTGKNKELLAANDAIYKEAA